MEGEYNFNNHHIFTIISFKNKTFDRITEMNEITTL